MGQTRLIRALALVVMIGALCWADAASARQRMSFSPGSHSRHAASQRHYGRSHVARSGRQGRSRHGGGAGRSRTAERRGGGSEGDAGEARAVPGGGFTMQDGVLTYPAPARFQPKNLKRN